MTPHTRHRRRCVAPPATSYLIAAAAVLGVVWAHVITSWSGRSISASAGATPSPSHLDELVWWQTGRIVVTMATSWWSVAVTLVAVAALVLVADALLRAGDTTPAPPCDIDTAMRVAGTGCVLLAAFLIAFTVTGGLGIGGPSVAWAMAGVVLWCIGIDCDNGPSSAPNSGRDRDEAP